MWHPYVQPQLAVPTVPLEASLRQAWVFRVLSPQTTIAFHRCLSAQACPSFWFTGSSNCVLCLEDASDDSFCKAAISRLRSRDPGTDGAGAEGVRARPQAQPGVRVAAERGAPRAKAGRLSPGRLPGLGGARVFGVGRRAGPGRAGHAPAPQAAGRRPESAVSPCSPGPRGRRPLTASRCQASSAGAEGALSLWPPPPQARSTRAGATAACTSPPTGTADVS
ncbi:uncharacterized protein [Manis javanica]|uniref:uncharacterized protein isoform X1 n=1 Tax=Manis javanica TaxID=9974 RepID=UPI003C6D08F5